MMLSGSSSRDVFLDISYQPNPSAVIGASYNGAGFGTLHLSAEAQMDQRRPHPNPQAHQS